MTTQLVVVCDMEGASGIFDDNIDAIRHGSQSWKGYGKTCLTSDVLAVCEASIDAGVEEILIYDMHYAGSPESNLFLDQLPKRAKLFDLPDRKFLWSRIRGQSQLKPLGLVTVGQHSRFGEPDAFFPHTIQTPPIKSVFFNEFHIAEIGQSVLAFHGVPHLANIGCAASMKEAVELTPLVSQISVKDKKKNWYPRPDETFPKIKNETKKALANARSLIPTTFAPPFHFSMELVQGFKFIPPHSISWLGSFSKTQAEWQSPSIEIGLELFGFVRACITKE